MADSGGIRAGKAFVEAYLDKTKLERGLRQIQTQIKAFGKGISTMGTRIAAGGAAMLAPMMLAVRNFMAVGDQLDKMSQRTGVSTNALSELGFAAEMSGASIEEVEKSIRKMQRTISDAASGEKTYVDALAMVGTSYERLKDLTPEQQFERIAEGLNAIDDPTRKAAAAMEIFGRSGTMLLPMLGDMRALREEAKRLGLSIGPEQAKAAADLEDAWTRVKRSVGAVAFAVGSALAPMLTSLAEKLKAGLGAVREWVSANRQWIVTTFAAGAAIMAGGTALVVLGKAISITAGALGAITFASKLCAGAITMLQASVLVLANPFVAAGVAIGAVVGYLLYARGAFQGVASSISTVLASIANEVTSTMATISDAMAAGDFTSAAKVAWALVQLEWTKGVDALRGIWETFRRYWNYAVQGLAIVFTNAMAKIQTWFYDIVGKMMDLATGDNFFARNFVPITLHQGRADTLKQEEIAAADRDRQKALDSGDRTGFERAITRRSDAEGRSDSYWLREARKQANAEFKAHVASASNTIERDRQAAVDILGEGIAQFDAESEKRLAASNAAVAAARDEWEQAKSDAVARTAAAGPLAAGNNGFTLPPEIDMAAAKGPRGGTSGTFSASAVGGLGGGVFGKIAKAVEDSKKIQQDQLAEAKRLNLQAAT